MVGDRDPAALLGIVKDDSQGVPVPAPHATHAMPQVHAIYAAGSFYRPMMDGEYHCITLPERYYLGARLHPRPLLGEDELAAGEVLLGPG